MSSRKFTLSLVFFGASLISLRAARAQVSPCPFNILTVTSTQDAIGASVGTFDSRTVSSDRQSGVALLVYNTTPNALPTGVDLLDYCFPNGLAAGVPISATWIHFDTGSDDGDGFFTILLDFDANPGGSSRTGTVSIGNATVQYTQSPAGCSAVSIALSGHSLAFPGDVTTIAAFTTIPTDPSCFTDIPPTPTADPWITVLDWTLESGLGHIRIDPNETGKTRTGSLQFGGASTPVQQVPDGCVYTLTAAPLSFTSKGGNGKFTLASAPNCDVKAGVLYTSSSWIHPSSPDATGAGTFAVDSNDGPNPADRAGKVGYFDQAMTITQSSGPCDVSISLVGTVNPASSLVSGDLYTVRNFQTTPTDSSCTNPGEPMATVPWIQVSGWTYESGLGDAVISPNNSAATRKGYVNFGTGTASVYFVQKPPGCTYTLTVTPTPTVFGKEAGSGTYSENASDACDNKGQGLATNASWIHPGPADDSGNGAFQIDANNTGADRTGLIAYYDQTATVTQYAIACDASISLTGSPVFGGDQATLAAFTTTPTDPGCQMAAAATPSASVPWITIADWTYSTGVGDIQTSPNATGVTRHGFITFLTGSKQIEQLPGNCEYKIHLSSYTFPAEGGSGVYQIMSTGACDVQQPHLSSGNPQWIVIESGPVTEDGTGGFYVAPNTTGAPRTGVVGVADQTATITQSGPQLPLSTTVNPPGAGFITSGGNFDVGASVPVSAVAAPGYVFTGFTGGLTGAGGTQSVLINGVINVTANFAPAMANTIDFEPLGNVSVGVGSFNLSSTASSGLGVTYTSATPGVCSVSGTTVTVEQTGTCTIVASQSGNSAFPAAASVAQTFAVVAAAGGFQSPVKYTVGSDPRFVAKGDFNGDGKQDLVVANTDSNSVSVLLGKGDGTFPAAVNYTVGASPKSIAVVDLNGDGKADLAVANFGDNNVTVLLGQGDGTFAAAGNAAVGDGPRAINAADFNGDGKMDLAVVNYEDNTISVLLGKGDGSFQTAVSYSVGANPQAIAIADLNGDGKPDIAVGNTNDNTLSVFLGKGDGTFPSVSTYAVGAGPYAVAIADFNGDGKPDLVTGNYYVGTVSVLLGTGAGAFANAATWNEGAFPLAIAVVDFNADGKLDLAVADDAGSVTLLAGGGDGTFQAPVKLNAGLTNESIVSGDFNSDGLTDLAITDELNEVYVLLGAPPAVTVTTVTSSSDMATYGSDAGLQFSATVSPASATGSVTFQDGAVNLGTASLSFGRATIHAPSLGAGTHFITAAYGGDITHAGSTGSLTQTINQVFAGITVGNLKAIFDGTPKAAPVTTTPAGVGVTVTYNGVPGAPSAVGDYAVVAMIADPNYAGGGSATGTLSIRSGAALSVTSSTSSSLFGQAVVLTATVTPSTATGGVAFYDGVNVLGTAPVFDGTAEFTTSLLATGPHSLSAVYGGDATYSVSASATLPLTVTAAAQKGFTVAGTVATGGNKPSFVAAGDFNGDGITDLVVANAGAPSPGNPDFGGLSVLLGIGNGTFQAPVVYSGNQFQANPKAIALGDFNGDGTTDIAVAWSSAGCIAVQSRVRPATPDATLAPRAANGCPYSDVSVFLGIGDGTFEPPINFGSSTGYGSVSITVGDFDRDGKADVAWADTGGVETGGPVVAGTGNGDGTEKSEFSLTVGAPSVPTSIAVGDFNGDGKTDLAAAVGGGYVLLGNGDGTFLQPAAPLKLGNIVPTYVAAGDVNGDGRTDLVLANAAADSISVLLGNGDGTFAAAVTYAVPGGPQSVFIQDLDGDGKPDLLVVAEFADLNNNVSVLPGNGDGTFGMPVTYAGGNNPTSAVAGDFNGDGRIDLAVADVLDGNLTILLGVPGGAAQTVTFAPPGNLTFGEPPVTLTATASSGLTVSFTSTTPSVCSVSPTGGLTLLGAGTCSITVSQEGDSKTAPASATQSFTVQQAVETIAFGSLSDLALGSTPPALSATASSGLPVTFSSNTPKVCTVSGTAVTILVSGGCSITAIQPGNGNFAAAAAVTQAFTVYFSDVTPADYYYNAVDLLAQYGITAGCATDDYCATQVVTRAEMAVFMVRAVYGSDNFTASTTPYFADVQPGDFGFKWIQKLHELGITSGCAVGMYCPNDSVTRDEMAIFIIRVRLGLALAGKNPTFTYPATPYFTDVPTTDFAFPWVQRMKQENITSGCTVTAYCASDPVIRGDMAIFIMRGAFNQLLPAGTPMLTQISPSTLAAGAAGTYTITGANTNFVQGTTTLSPIPGVTIGTITVSSPTTLTVQLAAAANAVAQPYSILAITGAEEDVLPNGLAIQ